MKLKTLKILLGCNGTCAVIWLVFAIVFPIVLENYMLKVARENVIMTPSTYDQWGLIPGKAGIVINRDFYFYNFTNPEKVLYQGEDPIFIQVGPYKYQEYQNFSQPSYSKENGTGLGLVTYNEWIFMNESKQGYNNSIQDIIQTVNLGPVGAWYQVKTADQNPGSGLLALQALGQLITSIESVIVTTAYAQGVQALLLPDYASCNQFFKGMNVDQKTIDLIWNDGLYGFQNPVSISIWVQGTLDGLNSANTKLLKQYFYLGLDQMNQIYVKMNSTINSLVQLLSNQYCAQFNFTNDCGPRFFTALQWSEQGLTLNPPVGPKTNSILAGNGTSSGFPEISYFLKNYFLDPANNITNSSDPDFNNYSQVVFQVQWAYNFLNRGNATNWLKDPNILLHIGNLQYMYEIGFQIDAQKNTTLRNSLLAQLQQRFSLDNIYQARVLWEYVKYMVNEFAIQQSKNGSAQTLGFGALAGQGFYQSFINIRDNLYDYLVNDVVSQTITKLNLNCYQFFNGSIDGLNTTQLAGLCGNHAINNQTFKNVDVIQVLRDACEIPSLSIESKLIQKSGNLTNLQLLQFCDLTYGTNTSFAQILNQTQTNIKNKYKCNENRTFCSKDEIAYLQWGQQNITMSPPDNFSLNASITLNQWNQTLFPQAIEYPYILLINFGDKGHLNVSQCYNVLNFNKLFSAALLASAAINKTNVDFWAQNFPGVNNTQMMNYLRYQVLEITLGGFVQQRTVQELIIGYEDPFLNMLKNQDPAIGGNPSINSNVSFGQNQSYESSLTNQRVMYSGEGDYTKLRNYKSAYGIENITVPTPTFNGNETVVIFRNPYVNSTPISGNDGAFSTPNVDANDISIDNIYVDVLYRSCKTEKSGVENYYAGIRTERFQIPSNFMQNYTNNQANANFYQLKYDGFLNFTGVMQAPVFLSKKHLLGSDQQLVNRTKVYQNTISNSTLIIANPDDSESFIDVEPYSGVSLNLYLKLQTNYLLQNDLLFNYNQSTDYIIPIFNLDRGGQVADSFINDNLGALKTGILAKKGGQIAGYCLFGVLFLVTVYFFIKYRKQSQSDLENPLLDH